MIKSIIGITFDCPDANELADFYAKLTGWDKEISSYEFAALRTSGGILLVFQSVKEYTAPVWPWEKGKQQQMAHIDFFVDDLAKTEELATELGARKSEIQYYDTSTVMFDPAGHPFCLSTVLQ
jgi:catechol 2,3-dioxygenase-like lactoylglutathione lyase family enzyme